MNAVDKIVARPITARKITGSLMQTLPYSFPDDLVVGVDQRFTTPLLGLPKQLQQLGFTYARNSLKTVYQNNALVTLAANQFGTTYDAVTGLHAFEAEPAATNLALYSSDLTNAVWTKTATTISANSAVAPDGTMTADKIVEDSATSAHYVSQSMTGKTMSVFAKAGERTWLLLYSGVANSNIYFNLATGVVGTALSDVASSSIIPVGNGWYRCSVTWTTSPTVIRMYGTTGNGVSSWAGNGTSGIYVWGAMDETGGRATSYIATAGATVTRAADVLSTATANLPGFNAAGYTLVVDGRRDVVTGVQGFVAEVGDATASNRSFILVNTTNTINAQSIVGGVTQASISGAIYASSRFKAAYSAQANSFKSADNGTGRTEDTAGTMPAVTTLGIGCRSAGSEQFNGYIYGFKLIPVALNQAQTTALTS